MRDCFFYFNIHHGTTSNGSTLICGQKMEEVWHKTVLYFLSPPPLPPPPLSPPPFLPPSIPFSLILTDYVQSSRNIHANGPSARARYVQGKSQTISPHLTQSSTFLPGTSYKLLTTKPLPCNTQYLPSREIGDHHL